MNKSKKVAYYGVFASLAILMGYVETIIQIPLPVPGIKLGLSNVIVLLAMYSMGNKEAFGISIVRVFVSAMLFKGFLSFWYSFVGALLSCFVMILAKKTHKLSGYGVSVLGGISHNIGQILVAYIILGRSVVLYLAPILIISGIITGFGIGVVVEYCRVYIDKIKTW